MPITQVCRGTNMKRLLLLLLVLLIATSSVLAEALENLASIRWQVLMDCHVAVAGTPQVPTAYVDSTINAAYQDMFTLDLDPYPYAKWDTIGTTAWTYLYSLPSDITEGGLVWCIRQFRDEKDSVQTMPMPIYPLPDVTVPAPLAPPKYVMGLYGQLVVHPVPVDPDTFVICYRAIPPKLAADDSVLHLDYKYRQMVVWRVCAAVKRRQGLYAEAFAFEALWTEAKRKRTATKTTSEEIIE